MRREFFFCVLFAVLLPAVVYSCSDGDLRRGYERRTYSHFPDSSSGSHSVKQEDEIVKSPHLYAAGVRYPADYDWQRDEDYGRVDCSLFLMRDDEVLFELPVSPEAELSSDQDMHHLVQGHLFTDYSTDKETVIKMDGRELFRLEGRQMLRGIHLRDGDIFTLWEPRQGRGLAFLRNAQVLFSDKGELLTALSLHEGRLSFACRSEDGKLRLVTDGEPRLLQDSGFVGEDVLFVCSRNSLFRIRKGTRGTYVCKDSETIFEIQADALEGMAWKFLLCDGDDIHLVGEKCLNDSTVTTFCLLNGKQVGLYAGKQCICACCQEGILWLLCQDVGNKACTIMKNGSPQLMDSKWRPFSSEAKMIDAGLLCLALCSDEGPAIWCSDGRFMRFAFNGFIDRMEQVME